MEEITLSLPRVSRMVSVDVLDNTQTLARELAAQGCEHGTLVLAYEQTAASGANGRRWQAGRGGVYFTLALQPKAACETEVFLLKTAEAAAQALKNLFQFKTKIKRGGEVLAWDGKAKSWRKIGAARAEIFTPDAQPPYLLVGADINVNNKTETSADASVKKLLDREIDPEWVLQETLEAFWTHYAQRQLAAN